MSQLRWNDVKLDIGGAAQLGALANQSISNVDTIIGRLNKERMQQEQFEQEQAFKNMELAERARQFGITNQFNYDKLAQEDKNSEADRNLQKDLVTMRINAARDMQQREWNREAERARINAQTIERLTGKPYAKVYQQMEDEIRTSPQTKNYTEQKSVLQKDLQGNQALVNDAAYEMQMLQLPTSQRAQYARTPEEAEMYRNRAKAAELYFNLQSGEYNDNTPLEFDASGFPKDQGSSVNSKAQNRIANPKFKKDYEELQGLMKKTGMTFEDLEDITNNRDHIATDDRGRPIIDSSLNPRLAYRWEILQNNAQRHSQALANSQEAMKQLEEGYRAYSAGVRNKYQPTLDSLDPGFIRDEAGNQTISPLRQFQIMRQELGSRGYDIHHMNQELLYNAVLESMKGSNQLAEEAAKAEAQWKRDKRKIDYQNSVENKGKQQSGFVQMINSLSGNKERPIPDSDHAVIEQLGSGIVNISKLLGVKNPNVQKIASLMNSTLLTNGWNNRRLSYLPFGPGRDIMEGDLNKWIDTFKSIKTQEEATEFLKRLSLETDPDERALYTILNSMLTDVK